MTDPFAHLVWLGQGDTISALDLQDRGKPIPVMTPLAVVHGEAQPIAVLYGDRRGVGNSHHNDAFNRRS